MKKEPGLAYKKGLDVRIPYCRWYDEEDEKTYVCDVNKCIKEGEVKYNNLINELLNNFIPLRIGKNNTEVKRKKQIVDFIKDNPDKFIFINPAISISDNEVDKVKDMMAFYIEINMSMGKMFINYNPFFNLVLNGMLEPHPDDLEGVLAYRRKLRPDTSAKYGDTITALRTLVKYFKMPVIFTNIVESAPLYQITIRMLVNQRKFTSIYRGANILKDLGFCLNVGLDDKVVANVDPNKFYKISYEIVGRRKSQHKLPHCKMYIEEVEVGGI